MRDFVNEKLHPAIEMDQADKRKFADSEGKWPDYPLTIQELVEEVQSAAAVARVAGTRALEVGQLSADQTCVDAGSREGAAGLNMYPHRIRLRGPWECEVEGQPLRRVTMPCRWGAAGPVRFTRKFGYPGRIDDGEHVWLTCAGCTGCLEVRLNGEIVAQVGKPAWGEHSCLSAPRFAYDVTSMLGPRNRLEIAMDGAGEDAGLWGDVALEIRRDAYLTDVRIERAEPGIRVIGMAVGVAPQPLEMYTLIDNRHADYRTIQPKPEGQLFQIDLPELTSANQVVRVDLIHVSAIWFAVEILVPRWQSE